MTDQVIKKMIYSYDVFVDGKFIGNYPDLGNVPDKFNAIHEKVDEYIKINGLSHMISTRIKQRVEEILSPAT